MTAAANTALAVTALKKKKGGKEILRGVDLKIAEGEIVGLAGRNGAGKSSLMKCVTGLWDYREGEIVLFGKDRRRERAACMKELGALVEYPALFPDETLLSDLRTFASLSGGKLSRELIALLGMEEALTRKYSALSSGMKQKGCLLAVLLRAPRLLVLDEPTSMLDPESAASLRTAVRELRERTGLTVLISSHDLAELETLCDRTLLMDEGKIVGEVAHTGSPARLYRMRFATAARAEELEGLLAGKKASSSGTELTVLWTAEEFRAACMRLALDFIDLRVGGELEYRFLGEDR